MSGIPFNPAGNPTDPLFGPLNNSNSGTDSSEAGNEVVDAPTTQTTSGTVLLYATLPLGIGVNSNSGQCVPRIEWKQFATSPVLVLVLLDANGVPRNLTGVTSVTLRLLPALGSSTLISEAMTVLYANGGQVSYKMQASDVATAGTFYLEVEAVLADGSAEYYPSDGTVLFVIHPSLGGP